MEYAPQNCSKCNDCPEDILMLNCKHDLCLQCAANRFGSEKKKNILCNGITCEICHVKTQLDRQSISELEKIPVRETKDFQEVKVQSIRNSMIQQAKKQKKPDHPPMISPKKFTKEALIVDNPSPFFNGPTKNNNPSVFCAEHPEDQILYFCLTCQCQCICPECVIHGPHKSHEVKTLKRASPEIKQKITIIIKYLEKSLIQVNDQRQNYEEKLKYFSDMMNSSKKKIKLAFDELKKKIQEQQELCLAKTDYFIESNKISYDKAISSLKKHMELVKSEIGVLNDVMKTTELKLLNNYAKNKRKYAELKDLENLSFPFPEIQFDHGEVIKGIEQLSSYVPKLDFADINIPSTSSGTISRGIGGERKGIIPRDSEQSKFKYNSRKA